MRTMTGPAPPPPLVEIVLGVENPDSYYFGSSSSSGFKLTLDEDIEDRFDDIEFVDADREDDNATLILTVRLIFDEDRYGNLRQNPAPPSGIRLPQALRFGGM